MPQSGGDSNSSMETATMKNNVKTNNASKQPAPEPSEPSFAAATETPATQLNGFSAENMSNPMFVDQNKPQQAQSEDIHTFSAEAVRAQTAVENNSTSSDDVESIPNMQVSSQTNNLMNPSEPAITNQSDPNMIMDIFGAVPNPSVDVENEVPLSSTILSPLNPFSASYVGLDVPVDGHYENPTTYVPSNVSNPFSNKSTDEQASEKITSELAQKNETVKESYDVQPAAVHPVVNMQSSITITNTLLPSSESSAVEPQEQPGNFSNGLPNDIENADDPPLSLTSGSTGVDPSLSSTLDSTGVDTSSLPKFATASNADAATASNAVTVKNSMPIVANGAVSPPLIGNAEKEEATVADLPNTEKSTSPSVSDRQENSSIGFMRDVEISKEEFDRFLEEMEDAEANGSSERTSGLREIDIVPQPKLAMPSLLPKSSEASNSEDTASGSYNDRLVLNNSDELLTQDTSSKSTDLHASIEGAMPLQAQEIVTSPVAIPYVPSPRPDPEGSPTFPLVRTMSEDTSRSTEQSPEASQVQAGSARTTAASSTGNSLLTLNVDPPVEEVMEMQNNYPETPPPPYSEEMHANYERSLTPLSGSAQGQLPSNQSLREHDEAGSSENQGQDGDFTILPSAILESITRPGETKPNWVPDQDSPQCSNCAQKFTFTRRRHHCRACGRVFCANCCSEKSQLKYMDYKEARVCLMCSLAIKQADALAAQISRRTQNSAPRLQEQPVPIQVSPIVQPEQPGQAQQQPQQEQAVTQAAESQAEVQSNNVAPTQEDLEVEGAMAGVTAAKSVRFSDGTRPKHPDEVPTTPPPPTRSSRSRKRHGGAIEPSNFDSTTLPPVVIAHGENGTFAVQENPDFNVLLSLLESGDQNPQTFILNPNLAVHVKFVSHCNRQCWCYWSEGMNCVGQREIALILERQGLGDRQISAHAFTFYKHIFDRARKGKIFNTADFMSKNVMGIEDDDKLFGLERNAGFLFVQTTSQPLDGLSCLKKRILRSSGINADSKPSDLPIEGMLFALLVQKTEAPWATLFPLRLMLRLGAEVKQYPCPLFSIRQREPVYQEIGHTILAILCDFHNFKYKVISVPGLRAVLSSNGNVSVQIPCNRFTDTTRIMNSSNESVLAIGSGTYGPKIPSPEELFTPADGPCDSHLVCIQDQENNVYNTEIVSMKNIKAINTGAAFVIFNGSLKSDGNHLAKCAIVEDGIMIQLLPEKMEELRSHLRSKEDFTIPLGVNTQSSSESANTDSGPNEQSVLEVKWVENDTFFNVGMFSPIDGTAFEGVVGFNVQGRSEQKGRKHVLRWNQVFFLASTSNPLDLSRLAEQVANGCFLAFTPVVHELVKHGLYRVGVRVTIHPENVGYIAGSGEKDLPPVCMNALDEHLIQTIHNAAGSVAVEQEAVVFELLFSVLLTKPSYRTA